MHFTTKANFKFNLLSRPLINFAQPKPQLRIIHSFQNTARFLASMAAEKYKLSYFNVRARAEPIRFIFALKEIPYEDHRIERPDWPAIKEKHPWGQLPILEVNGKVMAQSMAITRYLARKYDLVGANELESAKCDEYVDAISDLRANWRSFFFETDEPKREIAKKEFLENQVPKCFAKFEAILRSNGNGEFLVGNQLTWADLTIAHTIEFFGDTMQADILSPFPALKKFKEGVYNVPNIKNWIAKRPKTAL